MICFVFQIVDLVVLSVILLFLDIRRWKLRKIVQDSWQDQKWISYIFGWVEEVKKRVAK